METERRRHHRLRRLFDEACERLAPCFEQPPPPGLPLEWLLFSQARAAYPQLTTLELFLLAMASQRVYRSRQSPRLAC